MIILGVCLQALITFIFYRKAYWKEMGTSKKDPSVKYIHLRDTDNENIRHYYFVSELQKGKISSWSYHDKDRAIFRNIQSTSIAIDLSS